MPDSDSEFPAPESGFVVTHFLVVSDQDRSRDFYQRVFGAKVLLQRDPVIMKLANSWVILNDGGGPTSVRETAAQPPDSRGGAVGAAQARHCTRPPRSAADTNAYGRIAFSVEK